MNYTDLATQVTARLVDQIETGPGTWRMPWHTVPGVFHVRNAATGNHYRGANTLTLALEAIDAEHPTGWWATYKQWSDLDAQVRKGERSARIVKWVPAKTKDSKPTPASDDENRRTLVPRVYSVFNAAQVDGWTPPTPPTRNAIERHAATEAFIANTGAHITYGHNHAAYQSARDRIELPDPEQFTDTEAYYSTACHELTHWTGHHSRLGRNLTGRFGDDAYAAEELVAAIACAGLGITNSPRDDHASYLARWLKILNADPQSNLRRRRQSTSRRRLPPLPPARPRGRAMSNQTLTRVRWPLDPLLAAAGHPPIGTFAARIGVARRTVTRWRTNGLTDEQADNAAVMLGGHPLNIWTDWHDV